MKATPTAPKLKTRTLIGNIDFVEDYTYFEVKILRTDETSNILIGVLDPKVYSSSASLGLFNRSWTVCIANGKKYANASSSFLSKPEPAAGSFVGVFLNQKEKTVSFNLNGEIKANVFKDVSGPLRAGVELFSNIDQVVLDPQPSAIPQAFLEKVI